MNSSETINLTPALEDYLETIYRLISRDGVAHVRDIAQARDVRPGSVSPAMARLEQMELITYEKRDNVGLTEKGLEAAQRVFSRHQVLRRFFNSFLGLPYEIAENDACAIEHSLSPETINQMVKLFEYMEVCPEAADEFKKFHECSAVNPEIESCTGRCDAIIDKIKAQPQLTISDMQPGQECRIRQIDGKGVLRQRLLDMGLLPNVTLKLERKAPTSDPVWIKLRGFEMALRKSEAEMVLVEFI